VENVFSIDVKDEGIDVGEQGWEFSKDDVDITMLVQALQMLSCRMGTSRSSGIGSGGRDRREMSEESLSGRRATGSRAELS
jgi:hypothetical protein